MGVCYWLVASVIFRLVTSMQASERTFCNIGVTIHSSLFYNVYNWNEKRATYEFDRETLTKDKVDSGDIIVFRCDEGFTLIGASHLICNGSAWSGTMPKCVKNTCWWLDSENNVEFYINGTKIWNHSNTRFPNGTVLKYTDKAQCLVEILCQENGTWSISQPNCNIIDELTTESQLATKRVNDLANECDNYRYNSYMTWGFPMAVFSTVFTCSLLIFILIIFILMQRCKLNYFEKLFARCKFEMSVDNEDAKCLGPKTRKPETAGHYQEAEPLASGYEIPRELNLAAKAPVQCLDSSLIYEEIASNPL